MVAARVVVMAQVAALDCALKPSLGSKFYRTTMGADGDRAAAAGAAAVRFAATHLVGERSAALVQHLSAVGVADYSGDHHSISVSP